MEEGRIQVALIEDKPTDSRPVEDAEVALQRANRAFGTLTECNRVLWQTRHESELLQAVCRILVDVGGYRLAWVGFAGNDEAKTVAPAAQAGFEDGYLERAEITWADTERGRGPTGTAIRTGQPVIAKDVVTDPHYAPWRAEASRRGYASSIALPLVADGQPLGALNVYAAEQDAFDVHEVELLKTLAEHLAYGVAALRMRDDRQQAEEILRARNRELLALNSIATTINRATSLDGLLSATLDTVLAVVGMEGGWVQLLDGQQAGSAVKLVAHQGLPEETIQALKSVGLDDGPIGRVARSGEPVVVAWAEDRPESVLESFGAAAQRTCVCVPVKSRDSVVGVIGVSSATPLRPTEAEVQLLTAIGYQLGVAVDNSRLNRERAEVEVVRELNRLRAELIANVTHELRTPLGLIKIFASTLLREDADLGPTTQKEFLAGIEEEADKLERIIDNLLDLSRMESRAFRLEEEVVDVGQLALEVKAAMEAKHPDRSFVHSIPGGPLVANVDARRIEQVLRNLVENAVKYSPSGGDITVQGREAGGQVFLQVRDEGIGIPADELERIFERFYRVDNSVTQRVGGTGLGLAVCRGIVEMHGGQIWANSSPGAGSTFTLTLPVDPATGQEDPVIGDTVEEMDGEQENEPTQR